MNPSHPSNEPKPHDSFWIVLTHQDLEDLLNQAHAIHTDDKQQWVTATASQFAAASTHAKHHGAFILLTDLPLTGEPVQALSLRQSLDWNAYEALQQCIKQDVPPHWGPQIRSFLCESLHAVVLRHQSIKVRKAAAEVWANLWCEVQRDQSTFPDINSTKTGPSKPQPLASWIAHFGQALKQSIANRDK